MTPFDLALLVSGYILALTVGYVIVSFGIRWNDERRLRRETLRRLRGLR